MNNVTGKKPESCIKWAEFLSKQDLVWDKLPTRYGEAPFLGNGLLGSIIFYDEKSCNIRMEVFRTDVQDHRDSSYGWTAYSRPRFMIGYFALHTTGKIIGGSMRLDLWNAELKGEIQTDKGVVKISHIVHSDQMLIITEMDISSGEQECHWKWYPEEAKTARGGIPYTREDIEKYAEIYGKQYKESMKTFEPNPPFHIERYGEVNVCIQDLMAGGQYATAWAQTDAAAGQRLFAVSIGKSFPELTAADEAVEKVLKVQPESIDMLYESHKSWWHGYYPESFISIPDAKIERLYWIQIYKLACSTRKDRAIMDTSGPWLQPMPWPYITTDLNIQLCYWPVYASNRLHLGESLLNGMFDNANTLIENVRPVEWQEDSAFLALAVAQDMIGARDQDMRYYECVGCLTWTLHNCWLHYRFSMDDEMLKKELFPLLKRSVNLYLHMLGEGEDGKLHLVPTYSPEYSSPDGTKVTADCNFDLALLRWGCTALLEACDRLDLNDPLKEKWKDVLERLVDFPVDENGFMIGSELPLEVSHRHYSHLLMMYPLYMVNIEQADKEQLMERSLKYWIGKEEALAGYSWTGSSSMVAAMGRGNEALMYLQRLYKYLQPNTLYIEAGPCLETPLSAAQCIHDMLLQSWGGKIRVFPAVPDEWKDAVFHNMRTEGGFVVSALRKDGKTGWIFIESLAGESCYIKCNFSGNIHVEGSRNFTICVQNDGSVKIDLCKGEHVLIYDDDSYINLIVEPIFAQDENI